MNKYPYFIKSALGPETYPVHKGVELAFLGASNSGKSTLVNALLGKDLCKTSSKPGHTSLLNFFGVKNGLYFVDLPGYGFAKKSEKDQRKWQRAIELYLVKRENLALCYVLFDLKRGFLNNDFDLLKWLKYNGVPYAMVATKVDKLNQKEEALALRAAKQIGFQGGFFKTSSVKKKGLKELWSHIDGFLKVSASL